MNSKEKEVIKDLNVISMDKLGEKTILHGVEANNPSPRTMRRFLLSLEMENVSCMEEKISRNYGCKN